VSRPTAPRSPASGLPESAAADHPLALIIDDEPSIRLALRRFLARDGWRVEEAADGRIALALLIAEGPAQHFDLIICDLRMPGCTGAELYDQLKASRPALLRRLIVATGDAVSDDAAEFVRRTACPVLQKPFELEELRTLVRRVVAAA
jgi:DNA-binding NtrC family response regulator